MMKKLALTLLLFSVVSIASAPLAAQCAMCKATVESNIENGGKTVGRGLNDGILYLMSIPYLVLGGIGYMVYKNWKGSDR
jgi:hypothetical protein